MDSKTALENRNNRLSQSIARKALLTTLFPACSEEPFLLRQLESAILCAIEDMEPGIVPGFDEFERAALRLIDTSSPKRDPLFAARWLDLSRTGDDPLFLRQSILSTLKPVAGIPHVFLFIQGLRKSFTSDGGYFTQQRQIRYHQTRDWIDRLIRHWTTPSSQVHILHF